MEASHCTQPFPIMLPFHSVHVESSAQKQGIARETRCQTKLDHRTLLRHLDLKKVSHMLTDQSSSGSLKFFLYALLMV